MHVRAKKSLGQHFLKDLGIAQRIVDLLDPDPDEVIVEIGPGTGVLTQFLLEQYGERLHVVEVDTESVDYLEKVYPSLVPRIHPDDFLKLDLAEVFGPKMAVIGNFPYNISSQILFHVLTHRKHVTQVVGMFQREVAKRVCMNAGSKEYGILSVLLEAYFDRSYRFTVSEQVFNPPPKVKSGVLSLTRKTNPVEIGNPDLFQQLVKLSFNQRRKTLRNSLKSMWKGPIPDDPILGKRPEQLDLPGFLSLLNLIESQPF